MPTREVMEERGYVRQVFNKEEYLHIRPTAKRNEEVKPKAKRKEEVNLTREGEKHRERHQF